MRRKLSAANVNVIGVLRLGTLFIALVAVHLLTTPLSVGADPIAIDFESYTLGTINNQDGWSSLGAAGFGCAVYDHEFSSSLSTPGFGARSLRISNAVVSGCFSDQTFSKSLTNEAGETSAVSDGYSGGTRQNHFEAQFQLASTVPGGQQSGLYMSVSPDRGDGARMSYLRFEDQAHGIHVFFDDYQDGAVEPAGTCSSGDNFIESDIATLNRAIPHTIKFVMDFVDGAANDVVKIYIDGVLKWTGTSWEDYFRICEGNPTRPVDSLLFRTGGTAGDEAPDTLGEGFLIDNLSLSSSSAVLVGTCSFTDNALTKVRTLLGDCTTDQTLLVPDQWALDGSGFSITAIDPDGGHFLGAIIKNADGEAYVRNLTVTASGFADVCDAGNDRLRGILFDGAAGSITNNVVVNVNQGLSGCQEGNGIEVRNAPFDNTAPVDLVVSITGNVVSGYQKNGITANGSVVATITGNTVTGSGPVNYIAQNGIQVGFGATATVQGNTISGNNYTPKDTVACGLLLFQSDGVRTGKNVFSANEKDLCNFGRGGGNVNAAP
jgi:hypothetical protein